MQWISVKDELPYNGQDIIAWGPELYKPFSFVFRKEWNNPFVEMIIGSWDMVTHWMPLPQPPESKC